VGASCCRCRPSIVRRPSKGIGLQDVDVESGTNDDPLDIYRLSATLVAEQVREMMGRTA
jgi:hypothetical protein